MKWPTVTVVPQDPYQADPYTGEPMRPYNRAESGVIAPCETTLDPGTYMLVPADGSVLAIPRIVWEALREQADKHTPGDYGAGLETGRHSALNALDALAAVQKEDGDGE